MINVMTACCISMTPRAGCESGLRELYFRWIVQYTSELWTQQEECEF